MKTIGLIGGMSWESSIEYYRIINEAVRAQLGGVHSAKSLMYSVDFAEVEALQRRGQWREAAEVMIAAARRLEAGGADCVVICTNTMHKMAEEIQREIQIPLLHIADATAEAVKQQGIKRVGLLGTKYTMEEDFYRGRLEQGHALEVLIPGEKERELVHRVIFDELVIGKILDGSRERYRQVMQGLVSSGAEGIILGCTEIGLLVRAQDSQVPLFDTTRIHAEAAVRAALEG